MDIGKLKVNEGIKYLTPIAQMHGLKLNRASDFRIARRLFAIIYCRHN